MALSLIQLFRNSTGIVFKRNYRNSKRSQIKREKFSKRWSIPEWSVDVKTLIKDNYDKELECFLKRLSINYVNLSLYKKAFTHVSYNNEDCNELLCLEGYYFTKEVIVNKLIDNFPNLTDSLQSKIIDHIFSRENLGLIVKSLSLNDFLLVTSNVVNKQHEPGSAMVEDTIKNIYTSSEKSYIYNDDAMSDSFFGLVCAILKDIGIKEAEGFILDFLYPTLSKMNWSQYLDYQQSIKLTNSLLRKLSKPNAEIRYLSPISSPNLANTNDLNRSTDPYITSVEKPASNYNVCLVSGQESIAEVSHVNSYLAKRAVYIKALTTMINSLYFNNSNKQHNEFKN